MNLITNRARIVDIAERAMNQYFHEISLGGEPDYPEWAEEIIEDSSSFDE